MKQYGFSLAETLITLVVIGIVAALTIPTLIAKQHEERTEAQIKKTYSTLSKAMTFVKAAGGDTEFITKDYDSQSINNWFDTYMKPHLSTTKICYDEAGCWNDGDTLNLNGRPVYCNVKGKGIGDNIITAILNDGTLINFDSYGSSSMKYLFGIDTKGQDSLVIFFDINGKKQPNTLGKDIFVVGYKNSILVPAYQDKTQAQIRSDCSNSGTGYSCIQQYMANSN